MWDFASLSRQPTTFGVNSALRQRPMRSALLILLFTCASTSISSAPNPRHETIVGRVVAYSGSPACLNGNGYWAIVIRAQRPKDIHSEYIRVDFTLPCDKSPEWVSTKPSVQKFRLYRRKDCDAVLEESIDEEHKRDSAVPIWKYTSGADQETLPFGQVVPCYRSVDLPLAPAV